MIYFAQMPVRQLVVQKFIFLLDECLLEALPPAADRTSDVTNTPFLLQLVGNILVRIAHLLVAHDAGVVGIIVGLDRLGSSGFAAFDLDIADIARLLARTVDFLLGIEARSVEGCGRW